MAADLAAQIRAKLDGFAPPNDGSPPPQFVEILDPGDLTPEQAEDWQRHWDELFGTPAEPSMHILATPPRFYPGFEQMRDAVLAVLVEHRPERQSIGAKVWHNCASCRDTDWNGPEVPWPCSTVEKIAKALGIEASDD